MTAEIGGRILDEKVVLKASERSLPVCIERTIMERFAPPKAQGFVLLTRRWQSVVLPPICAQPLAHSPSRPVSSSNLSPGSSYAALTASISFLRGFSSIHDTQVFERKSRIDKHGIAYSISRPNLRCSICSLQISGIFNPFHSNPSSCLVGKRNIFSKNTKETARVIRLGDSSASCPHRDC